MINHVRTLLMNRAKDGAHYTEPGEEFIDPAFVPRLLPRTLRRAHAALFGSAPDRLFLNYRARQVMELLHSTELEEYVYASDGRVTYLPMSQDTYFSGVFGVSYTQHAGAPLPLTIHGAHAADDGAGITTNSWALEILSPTQALLDRLTPPFTSGNVVEYTQSNGLSGYVTLPGSDLRIKFPTADAEGAAFHITSRARPGEDITARLGAFARLLDDATLSAMFLPRQEPLITFENSYRDNDLFAYKMSGLLLAAANYIEGLPQDAG